MRRSTALAVSLSTIAALGSLGAVTYQMRERAIAGFPDISLQVHTQLSVQQNEGCLANILVPFQTSARPNPTTRDVQRFEPTSVAIALAPHTTTLQNPQRLSFEPIKNSVYLRRFEKRTNEQHFILHKLPPTACNDYIERNNIPNSDVVQLVVRYTDDAGTNVYVDQFGHSQFGDTPMSNNRAAANSPTNIPMGL